MKYSKSILIALLGTELFNSHEVNKEKNRFLIETEKPLDIFSSLLFFFLYEENFKPNKFIQFFCGIEKITDLKERKYRFRENLDFAFESLSKIRINGIPFLTYERVKNRWKYTLSPEALSLKEHFYCDLNSEDFWVEGKRRGISVAYMGAYIYLMGVLGKTEIDLKYLDNKKILNDFSAGYPIWKARKTIKSLVLTFASRKVFGYGKRLEALNDFVLHVKQKNQKSGLVYKKQLNDFVITRFQKNVYYAGKFIKKSTVYFDFEKNRRTLAYLVSLLNNLNMDIRHNNTRLGEKFFLEFEDSRMNHFLSLQCPVTGLKRTEWKNVTFGKDIKAAVIEIDFLRTNYMLTHLKRKGIDFEKLPANSLYDRIPKSQRKFVIELALESMSKYSGQLKRMRQSFRWKLHHYTRLGATKREINSFFYFVSERCFQTSRGSISNISEDSFIRNTLKVLFGTLWELPKVIPMIVTMDSLIVPRESFQDVLLALSNSYRKHWGDKRNITFKVTTPDSTKHYRFTTLTRMKEVTL